MTKMLIYDCGDYKKIPVSALNEKQYRDIYDRACNKFNDVNQDNVTMSWVNGLYYGYLICKGK